MVQQRGFEYSRVRTFALALIITAASAPARGATGLPAGIAWRSDVSAAARESATRRKSILMMVKARWCGPCQQMLRQSFFDRSVVARVNENYIPLLIDADEQGPLIQQLKIAAFPTTLILDSNQRVIDRMTGFQTGAQLNARLAAFQRLAIPRRSWPLSIETSQPHGTGPSFHDRAWTSIRNSLSHGLDSGPPHERRFRGARDTYSAALDFSAAR